VKKIYYPACFFFLDTAELQDYEDSNEDMETGDSVRQAETDGKGNAEEEQRRWEDGLLQEEKSRHLSGSSNLSASMAETAVMPQVYHTIHAARQESRWGLTGEKLAPKVAGSFVVPGDTRIQLTQVRCSYSKMLNVSSSFNIENMECLACESEHMVLAPEHEKKDLTSMVPVTFYLADQNFPAILPPTTTGTCIKILRIEDGKVEELVQRLLEVIKGFSVPAGSTIVVSSLSQLCCNGPQAYASSIREANRMLSAAFGRGIRLMHGPPVPCFSMSSEDMRAWEEVDSWLASCATESRLETASGYLRSLFKEKNPGAASGHSWTGLWPRDLSSNGMVKRVSQGFGNYDSVPPLTEMEEGKLIQALTEELNRRTAANLCSCPTLTREVGIEAPEKEDQVEDSVLYVILGASHAGRIADELVEKGEKVVDLSRPGWKPTRDKVQQAMGELTNTLKENGNSEICIVYHLLDNAVYYGKVGGKLLSAEKSSYDDLYHIRGELEMVGDDGLKDIMHTILPLLRAGGEHKKLVISPIQRYVPSKCCEEVGHITNFSSPDYAANMVGKLKHIREALRSFINKRNVRNFRVASGEKLLGWEEGVSGEELKELWGPDPIHLTTAGYKVMADKIVEMATGTPFLKARTVTDETKNRSIWVTADDAAASRAQRGGSRRVGLGAGGGGERRRPLEAIPQEDVKMWPNLYCMYINTNKDFLNE